MHHTMLIQRQVFGIIKEEFVRAGLKTVLDINDILVPLNSNVVIENTSSNGLISESIIEHHFPKITTEVELAHFTDYKGCKGIIESGELQLASILKWISESEFRSFAETHGLHDYSESSNGDPYYKTLMCDLFYASFTKREPNNLTDMWDTYAERGTGAKFVFKMKVVQQRSELRPILYHSSSKNPPTLIKSLSDRIFNECGRHFVMRGISRIGAFYLPMGYGYELEDESRLLVKAWDTGSARNLIIGNGDEAYLPLKIGKSKNEFCDLELVEVQSGPKSDVDNIRQLLTQNPWSQRALFSAA